MTYEYRGQYKSPGIIDPAGLTCSLDVEKKLALAYSLWL